MEIDQNVLYVLGANDPEMEHIEGMLEALKLPYGYALCNNERVHAGNAYKASDVRLVNVPDALPTMIQFIECDLPNVPYDIDEMTFQYIDHHAPDDPGYRKPPGLFLEGSSIGQLILHLCSRLTWEQIQQANLGFKKVKVLWQMPPGAFSNKEHEWITVAFGEDGSRHHITIPDNYRYAAASDHCPLAAYQGHCPTIDPEILMEKRLQQKAEYKGIDLETLAEVVNESVTFIHQHQQNGFLDLVELGYDIIPEGAEASLRSNVTLVSKVKAQGEKQKLVMLNGAFERTKEWMEEQQAKGREVYGNPYRGYAGAYL